MARQDAQVDHVCHGTSRPHQHGDSHWMRHITSPNNAMKDRKDILLRAAYDLLKRSTEPGYVQDAHSILVQYDGTDCDGLCLMEDIAIELDLPDRCNPLPLKGNY